MLRIAPSRCRKAATQTRPDPPAAMHMQLRDVIDERTRHTRRSSPRWRWPAASCRSRRGRCARRRRT